MLTLSQVIVKGWEPASLIGHRDNDNHRCKHTAYLQTVQVAGVLRSTSSSMQGTGYEHDAWDWRRA